MSANDKQVGGSHYKSPMQHWDFCEIYGLGYLESAATKYLVRWRNKNGIQDMEKAIHYLEKLRELNKSRDRRNRCYKAIAMNAIVEYCEANKLTTALEKSIHIQIFRWRDQEDLYVAITMIKELINVAASLVSSDKPVVEAAADVGFAGLEGT